MKCPEAEEKIYLYRELTSFERDQVDNHLKNCLSCRQIMARVNHLRHMIAGTQAEVPSMANEARMTSRIMDALQEIQRKKTTRWGGILQYLQTSSLRYGMTALSFCLVIFFIGEYAGGGNLPKVTKHYPRYRGKKTELNLASFHGAFLHARENDRRNTTLISGCITACLQSQGHDCTKCSDKFAKQ